jgi:hypothetical protein
MRTRNFTTEAQRHGEKPKRGTHKARHRFVILRLGHRGSRAHGGDTGGTGRGGRRQARRRGDRGKERGMRTRNFTTEAQRHGEKPQKGTPKARHRFVILRLGHRGNRAHGGDTGGAWRVDVMASVGTFRIGFWAVAQFAVNIISVISASSVRQPEDDEVAFFLLSPFRSFSSVSLCLCGEPYFPRNPYGRPHH